MAAACFLRSKARGQKKGINSMITQREKMVKVSASRPCPICRKPDWCLVAPDGSSTICQRVQSDKKAGNAGWLHVIKGATTTKEVANSADTAKADNKAAAKLYTSASDAISALSFHRGQPTRIDTYRDGTGQVVGKVLRWDTADDKTFLPLRRSPDGWTCEAMPAPRPLFDLPTLLDTTDTVFVGEGEKVAGALAGIGLTCTTSPGGAKSASSADWSALKDRPIVVLPDNDAPGLQYAVDVAAILHGKAKSIKIVQLPGLEAKGDIVDWLQIPGNDKDALLKLVTDAPLWTPPAATNSTPSPPKMIPQSALLVQMALDAGAEFFHTAGGQDAEPFVTIMDGDRQDTFAVSSKACRQWLGRLFWDRYEKAPVRTSDTRCLERVVRYRNPQGARAPRIRARRIPGQFNFHRPCKRGSAGSRDNGQ